MNQWLRQEEELELYKKHCGGLHGSAIGLPDNIWDAEDEGKYQNSFLALFYNRGQELQFLIIMFSKVFITNAGQTVDVIIC
jgi:hypothetical protein